MNSSPLPLHRLAVCIDNTGYTAALEVRKIYQILPDADAKQHNYVRVIDESGEDYLYPASYFIFLDLPQAIQEVLLQAA